jgi:hypothetical protein
MLDTAHLLPRSRAKEVGRAGGAERHGTAVPGRTRRRSGRVEGGRGRPPRRGLPPERPRMDRALRAWGAVLARRPVAPAEQLPPPDPRRDRGPHLRAAPRTPRVGTEADRTPPQQGRGRARAVALVHLQVPAAPRPHRAQAASKASRGLPALRARAAHAAVADGRDGRRDALRRQYRHAAEAAEEGCRAGHFGRSSALIARSSALVGTWGCHEATRIVRVHVAREQVRCRAASHRAPRLCIIRRSPPHKETNRRQNGP